MLKLTRADIRDSALHMKQNKTCKKLAIEITGDPAQVIERISRPPEKIKGAWLIQDESDQPFTYWILRNRFDEATEAGGATFQFRDIRAKAATDTGDLGHAQKLLGHANRDMGTSKNLIFQKSRVDKSSGYKALGVKIRGFSRCPHGRALHEKTKRRAN